MEIYYHNVITPCGQPADVVISALQKFVRRAQTENAVRAAYELYHTSAELTEYLWKRLLVISAEDIGLGEPMASVVVRGLWHTSLEFERDSSDYQLFFVHAVRYLCSLPKERGSSVLSSLTKRRIRRGDSFELPDFVFDMHTIEGQKLGRNIEHFLDEAAFVCPDVPISSAERHEEDAWRRELIALMKEEDV